MNLENNESDHDSDYETEEETLVYLPLNHFEEIGLFNDKNATFEFKNLEKIINEDTKKEENEDENHKLTLKLREGIELSGKLKNNCGTLLFFQDQAAANNLINPANKDEVKFVGSSINICPLQLEKININTTTNSHSST